MSFSTSPNRALHLIDAANEIGSGHFDLKQAMSLHSAWLDCVPLGPLDIVVAATGPGTKSQLAFGFPTGQIRIRAGRNGADFVIIDELNEELRNVHTYNHLYLGSGDHEMIPAIKKWIDAGVPVTIVAHRNRIHSSYRDLDVNFIYINDQWTLAS